ncbi:MAG: hypothetical protein M1120_02455 [Patescibacteria group bacterium]|nr:hypothetical protein [Patescibacteria group bacterium]
MTEGKAIDLSREQKKLIAEFCVNFAIVWLGAGIVTPIIFKTLSLDVLSSGVFSLFWALFLMVFAVNLVKGVK